MRLLSAVLFAASVAVPAVAQTQTPCADRAVVTERLQSAYGERFAGGGLRNSQSIFEVWMAEDTGTWTIIMTMPNGQACVMAAGTDWRVSMPETPAGIPG